MTQYEYFWHGFCAKYIDYVIAELIQFFSMILYSISKYVWSRRDRIVVGFTITCVISAYLHYLSEFESIYGKVYSIQHYVIK